MRLARPLLALATALLLVGGAVPPEPGGATAPGTPTVWDDGLWPEPRALDARIGAGCAPDPSVADDQLVASSGTAAPGIDAACTWRSPDRGAGGGPRPRLQ